MEERAAVEDIGFLARSYTRVRILDEICRTGGIGKDTLGQRIAVSRTTIQRNLDALKERGWVRDMNEEYESTVVGEAVFEGFTDLIETIRVTDDLKEFLNRVPTEEFGLDPMSLTEATILLPEPNDPYAMINRHVRRMKRMSTARGVLRVTSLHAHEAAHDAVVENGGRYEVVLTPGVADTWQSKPGYSELTREMLDTGRLRIFECEDDLPFSLSLIDHVVHLLVDDQGMPRVLLEAETTEIRKWGEETFEAYRQRARPLA